MNWKQALKKTWHFIWEEDSLASWIVNVILAFLIVKFLIYPGLGLLLGTQFPVVAVVSGSMEHDGSFDQWWQSQEAFYTKLDISKQEFQTYPFKNGFNKGDLMILTGAKTVQKGDILVFKGGAKDPIIHRAVTINQDTTYQTKGDHNTDSRQDEMNIKTENVLGKARIRIPLLGWFKLAFVKLLNLFGLANL